MATSFPQRPLFAGDAAGRSHHLLWQLASSQLPDDVTLYPNVSMRRRRLRSADAPQLETSEAVVVDPEHGVTLLVVARLAGPTGPAGELVASLLATLSGRAATLLGELAAMLVDGDPALAQVPLRWALALPGVELDHRQVEDIAPEALWDHGAIVGAEALANAYHALWTVQRVGSVDGERRPQPAVVDRVHRRLVQRSASGVSYLADRQRHDDERLQGVLPAGLLRTALGVVEDGSCLVSGGPGTGKTTVGIEVAAAAAARGSRVLVTTPHRALGRWLRQRLADVLVADGLLQAAVRVGEDPRGRLVVGDVAGLSGATPGEGEDAQRFFDAQAPDWVSPRRFGGRFDLVVVDEWHAIAAGHRAALAGMLAPGGRLVALADPSLADATDDLASPSFQTHVALATDMRSAPLLAENRDAVLAGEDVRGGHGSGHHHSGDAAFGDAGLVDPSAVTWLPAPEPTLAGVAQAAVEDLVDAGTTAIGDVAVLRLSPGPRVVDAEGQDHLAMALRGRGLVVAPAASFAGLHRPTVVLVLDTDRVAPETSGDDLRRLVTLAASRATEHLVVVGDPSAIRLRGLGILADNLTRATQRTPEPLSPA